MAMPACKIFSRHPSAHASSIPPPCGSISLYGVRHMEKKAGTIFCKPAYKAFPVVRLLMPARFRLPAAPSRCMASAIWRKRPEPSSASQLTRLSRSSVCSCQLDSAALRLHLAVWRPPYEEKGRNHLLQASLQVGSGLFLRMS